MKKVLIICAMSFSVLMYSCGGPASDSATSKEDAKEAETTGQPGANPSYDPERGQGKFSDVEIPATIDASLAASGEKVYNIKCSSCHKLTGEKMVGPGWKEVTQRHKAAWILNFITNPDDMIDKDPKAQAMLELCMVRMPNQNLADEDARAVYEFMRKNDSAK